MLRSYEYTEKPYKRDDFQSDAFREKEVEIAYEYVITHLPKQMLTKKCPLCGNESAVLFYTKWNVDYVRCDNCQSIYALCHEMDVDQYQKNEKLFTLRTSQEYQQEVLKRREESWNDFLEWLEVRSYRFMKRNRNLSVIDIGDRYQGYVNLIKKSAICGKYNLRASILQKEDEKDIEQADVVLYLDQMQREKDPVQKLRKIYPLLKEDGILLIGTRAGSGFDILTLKENNARIYPYEHITLPSITGLVKCIEAAGYQVLEVTTPGVMDVQYVLENADKIVPQDAFVQYLMKQSEDAVLQEFQRFLQKSGLSSFVRIIARKVS